MKRKLMTIAAAVVLSLAFAGVALAFAMGNVDGVWGTVDTDGAVCDNWATGPAGGSTDYDNPSSYSSSSTAIQTPPNTDWNQVRYGEVCTQWDDDECEQTGCPDGGNWKSEFALQSGFGFDGVGSVGTGLDQDEAFYLGKFCHHNNPIQVGSDSADLMDWVDLDVTVDNIECDDGSAADPATMTFTYRFNLDETPNDPDDNPGNVCPYGDTEPCGDQVEVDNIPDDQVFVCQVQPDPDPVFISYTVSIIGFIPEGTGGCPGVYSSSAVTDTFFSDEGADNCGCLWSKVSEYTPTAVDLGTLTATRERRAIRLEWSTTNEVDNLGFNLYRATEVNGRRIKLNAGLIPSQVPPGSPIGAKYAHLDTSAKLGWTWDRDQGFLWGRTYYYWLEDVDIYGNVSLHGPVESSPAGGPLIQVYPIRWRPGGGEQS